MAKSILATSLLFSPMTSRALRKRTSSQESVDGHSPSNSQDGHQIGLFGQEVVPVSPSLSEAKTKGQKILATCGRYSRGSSDSQNLTSSLASRLRMQSGGDGWTDCAMILKQRITPAGRVYFHAERLGDFTRETDCTGGLYVPTPTACDHKGSGRPRKNRGPGNNLRDWFMQNFNLQYPPVRLVGYLMGFPKEWVSCGVSAMQSCRKSRRGS